MGFCLKWEQNTVLQPTAYDSRQLFNQNLISVQYNIDSYYGYRNTDVQQLPFWITLHS